MYNLKGGLILAGIIMNRLVREMLETLVRYRERAVPELHSSGKQVHVFNSVAGAIPLKLAFPNPDFTQPPRELEKKLGLSGLAGNYYMPSGMKAEALQTYVLALRQMGLRGEVTVQQETHRLAQIFALLVADNRVLDALCVDKHDRQKIYEVVRGITSGYNVRDIQFFHDVRSGAQARQDPAYAALWTEVAQQGVDLTGWIPAPSTLRDIRQQLAAKSLQSKPGGASQPR